MKFIVAPARRMMVRFQAARPGTIRSPRRSRPRRTKRQGNPVERKLGAFPGEKLNHPGRQAETKLLNRDTQAFTGDEMPKFVHEHHQTQHQNKLQYHRDRCHFSYLDKNYTYFALRCEFAAYPAASIAVYKIKINQLAIHPCEIRKNA